MRGKTPLKAAVVLTAAALLAAGCVGKSDDDKPKTGPTELRIYNSEPGGLIPPKTDQSPGIIMIRQLFRGLVDFDSETGKTVNVVADSITSSDNKVWKIKLKTGYKFDNGEAVTSDSFINAWNYAAYGPNAQANSSFFASIVGFDDLQSVDPDGEEGPKKAPDPKAKELSGLKKVDDQNFEVTLANAFAGFPAVVGYSGFFPLAKACLADIKACEEKPIGNGPYKLETWEHKVRIVLTRSDDWGGPKAKVDKLNFKLYEQQDAAYADYEGGKIDLMEGIPPTKYKDVKSKYSALLFEKPSDTFSYLGFPLYNKNFQDKRIRQALSMAIDRQAVIDAVFDGRFSPAEGVISPGFQGSRKGACKNCVYDVEKAKALLAEAGGWKGGKLVLWANAGVHHEDWLQVVGDQIKKNLGIEYELKVNLQFPEYQATGKSKAYTGPFRKGWGPDYRVAETYLRPLYGTNGSANVQGYSNPTFDELVSKGDGAATLDEGIAFYQQAEDIIVDELPVIPLWFGKVSNLRSDRISKYVPTAFGGTAYDLVEVK